MFCPPGKRFPMGRMDVTVVGAVKTSVSVAVAELMLVPVTVMVTVAGVTVT